MRSLAEDDDVFCGDTSIDIDEVCVCVVFGLIKMCREFWMEMNQIPLI